MPSARVRVLYPCRCRIAYWAWGALTLAVVAEGHLGLAKPNCVFSRGNAIELLQLGLVDALHVVSTVVAGRGVAARKLRRGCVGLLAWLGK